MRVDIQATQEHTDLGTSQLIEESLQRREGILADARGTGRRMENARRGAQETD